MDKTTTIFETYRPRLFRLAYGMLGRVAAAEDAVQEAFLRWQKVNSDDIHSEEAYLSTIVSRICLDEIKSARNRREQYIGPDLPEPLVKSEGKTPEQNAELAESLSMALAVVLKQLNPTQRAVFLLREVFDYDYSSIADIVNKSESHCRKIAQRARDQVEKSKPIFEPTKEEQRRLVESFMEAVMNGELSTLENILADEAVLYSDGGGKATAAPKPIEGAHKIARFMLSVQKKVAGKVSIEFREINGDVGLVHYLGGRLYAVWSFFIENGKIAKMFVVLNPEKLEHLKAKG